MARALILVATATAFLANAALTGTARSARLRWEATGGPAGGRVREVVSLQSRLLLLGPEPGWRSADRVTRWEPLPELADWPSIFSANGDDLYADALSLAIDSTGDLVGGTPQGVFRARIDR
jgi:hypothetical protein